MEGTEGKAFEIYVSILPENAFPCTLLLNMIFFP